jgi:nucleolar protein 15
LCISGVFILADPEYESDTEEETNEPSTISKRGKSSSKRKPKHSSSSKSNGEDSHQPSSVIYLGHLPAAFEERELIIFLNQFGPVNKCRVSRSTKTGRSRGYAFVEFNDEEVASIVAEAMNGYFLLEKRLVCHVLPRDKVYDLMFKRPRKVMSKREIQNKARAEVNRRKTPEVMKGITAKLVQREEAKRKKLADLGIDYDFPGYAAGAKAMQTSGDKNKKDGPSKKKRKVSMDDKENSADEEENSQVQQKTPKASKKTATKENTEVKKDKKKKDKKRTSLA